jgi:hypothetical protein
MRVRNQRISYRYCYVSTAGALAVFALFILATTPKPIAPPARALQHLLNGPFNHGDKLGVPAALLLRFLISPELNSVVPLELTVLPQLDALESEVAFHVPKEFEVATPLQNPRRSLRDAEEQTYTIYVRRIMPEEAEVSATLEVSGGDFSFTKRTSVFVGEEDGVVYVEPNPRKYVSPEARIEVPAPVFSFTSPSGVERLEVTPKQRAGGLTAAPTPLAAPGSGQIVVQGYWKFQDRNGVLQPLRSARVEIWDDDGILPDERLAILLTDNSGYFQSPALSNSDQWGTLDIYVKVFATDSWSVNVTDFAGTLYSEETSTSPDVPDGYVYFPSLQITDVSRRPAYFIHDKIANDAYNYLGDQVGWTNNYNLQVRWSSTNYTDGTHYHEGGTIDLLALDRWDADVFLHEYGHFVMYKIKGNHMPDHPNCSNHTWTGATSKGCAWVEGWADFLQAPIQGHSDYRDTEDVEFSISFEPPSPWAQGGDVEGAVTASLWDVYDSHGEAWDTISLGINGPSNHGIWYILDTYVLDNAQGFYNAWCFEGSVCSQVTDIFDHHFVLDPPLPPSLSSPTNGQTGVSTRSTLSWSDSRGATRYDVYLGTSSPPPIVAPDLETTSYPAGPLSAGTKYYWEVMAANNTGSTASSTYSFTTASPPPPPTLVSPGSASSPGPVIGTTTPTFYWTSVSGADYYGLYIRQYPYGEANVVYQNEGISAGYTSFTVPGGYLPEGVIYRWNMSAHNNGGWSNYSDTLYFQVADMTPPTVSITSPTTGAAVSGLVTVSANASDNVDVVGVQFKLDGANLGAEDKAPPYSVSWNTETASNGPHALTASAYDAAGNQRLSSPVTVTVSNVDNTPPTTTITGGPSGTINFQDVNFTWTGSDNATPSGSLVYAYRLHPLQSSYSGFISVTTKSYAGLSNGPYTFYVKARDQAGNEDPTPDNRTFTVSLPIFSPYPPNLSFGSQLVNTTSPAQPVTVTNTGTATLTINSVSLVGTNPGDFAKASDGCSGVNVAPNNNCVISVTFRPTVGGPRSATLSFSDNATGSPHTVPLTGTGTDFTLAAASGGSTSATANAGQTATYNLQIAPAGLSGSAALSCSWTGSQPTGTNCTVSPTSVNLDGTNAAPFTVTVTTTARSLAGPRPHSWPPARIIGHRAVPLAVWLLGLMMLVTLAAPRRRRVYASLAVSMLFVLLWAACGGGGGGGGGTTPPPTGTPAGTYTLTVTGTASGVSRTTSLTLKVN